MAVYRYFFPVPGPANAQTMNIDEEIEEIHFVVALGLAGNGIIFMDGATAGMEKALPFEGNFPVRLYGQNPGRLTSCAVTQVGTVYVITKAKMPANITKTRRA